MVPGSTLMDGLSLRMETRRSRAFRIRPMLAAVMPFPSEEVTPPVTKTYFAMGSVLRGFFECYRTTRSPARREEQMDFVDVVMRRRAVRRFEERDLPGPGPDTPNGRTLELDPASLEAG